MQPDLIIPTETIFQNSNKLSKSVKNQEKASNFNQLYPVFFKMDRFTTLVVGGGEVATEKLTFLLKSSPNARVKVIAPEFCHEVLELSKNHEVELVNKEFDHTDLEGIQLVVAATNIHEVNYSVYEHCKELGILINVADTPPLCDFYLGGIVGVGTLLFAFGIGPAVSLGIYIVMKFFN